MTIDEMLDEKSSLETIIDDIQTKVEKLVILMNATPRKNKIRRKLPVYFK